MDRTTRDDEFREKRILLGSLFESSRILANYTREQLAEKTKVPLAFIHSLETGEQIKDPESIYTRGFVRILCKAIRIDTEEFLLAFAEAQAPAEKTAASVITSDMPLEQEPNIKLSPRQRKVESKAASLGIGNKIKILVQQLGHKLHSSEASSSLLVKVGPIVAGIVVVLAWTLWSDSSRLEKSPSRDEKAISTIMTPQPSLLESSVEEQTGADIVEESQIAESAVGLETLEQQASQEKIVDSSEQPSLNQNSSKLEPIAAQSPQELQVAEQVASQKKEAELLTVPSQEARSVSKVDEKASSPQVAENLKDAATTPAVPLEEGLSQVRLEASDAVVVRLSVNSGAQESYRLEAGEKKVVNFEKKLQVLVLDAHRVSIFYNGVDLGSLGGPGRVRRLTFSNQESTDSQTF